GITVANNLIHSTHAPLFEGEEGPGYRWINNLVFGAPLGLEPRDGLMQVDPQLVEGDDGLWRPGPESPAVGQAVAVSSATSGLVNIGADPELRPLFGQDVGPSWTKAD
ncbi:MAG: hypothetical protein AAF593_17200, partial [Planctomycetota bacterium]